MARSPFSINGWLVAALLIFLSYGLYYTVFYPHLLKNEQETTRRLNWTECSSTANCANYKVTINVPRYFSTLSDNIIDLSIQNTSQSPITGTLSITAILYDIERSRSSYTWMQALQETVGMNYVPEIQSSPNYTSTENLLPAYLEKEPEQQYVDFKIPGYGVQNHKLTFSKRLPGYDTSTQQMLVLQVNHSQSDNQVSRFHWEGNDTCKPFHQEYNNAPSAIKAYSTFCIPVDDERSFRLTLIQQLIQPPWSNGVIPVFVLSLVWLAEKLSHILIANLWADKNTKEDTDSSFHFGRFLLILFLTSFIGFVTLYLAKNIFLTEFAIPFVSEWTESSILKRMVIGVVIGATSITIPIIILPLFVLAYNIRQGIAAVKNKDIVAAEIAINKIKLDRKL